MNKGTPKPHLKRPEHRHTPAAANDLPGAAVLSPLRLKESPFIPPRGDDSPTSNSKPVDSLGLNSRKGETKTKTTASPNSNQETSDALSWAKKTVKPAAVPGTLYSPKNFLYKIGVQKKNWMLFQTLNCSTKDCFLCAKKKGLRAVIKENLEKKYLTSRESYNVKVINDVIYNENTHLVAVFKDYLIYDDVSEFLKRFYVGHESATRLPKVYDFYNKYSKVFPNYVNLEEKKFMFKNIERKQRLIDEQQKCMADIRKKKTTLALTNSEIDDKVFTTHFMGELNKPDSILGRTLRDEASISMTQMQNYKKNKVSGGKKQPTGAKGTEKTNLEEISLHQLVEKFIMKDSQSVIDVSAAFRESVLATAAAKKATPIQIAKKVIPTKPEPKHYRIPSAGSTKNLLAKVQMVDLKPYATRQQPKGKLEEPVRKPSVENTQSRNTQGVTGVWTSPKRVTSSTNRVSSPGADKCSTKTLGPQASLNGPRSKSQGKAPPTARRSDPLASKSKTPGRSTSTRPASSLGTRNEQKRPLTRQASLTNNRVTTGITRTISHTPRLSQGSTPLTITRKTTQESSERTSHKTSITKAAAPVDKKELLAKKKVLAIDIEALNKNLQKQKLALDSKMLRTAKAAPKTTEYCSNRTPDPTRKKFKSDYLNNLKRKIENRLSMDEEACRKHQTKAESQQRPLIGSILTSSKSISNLTKGKSDRAAQLVYQSKAFQNLTGKRLGEYRSPHVI